MNRILYFVHYNKYNFLSDHVLYLLRNVRTIYARIVVISNSPLSEEQAGRLSNICDEILVRENKGFDFGAWKDALLKDGWEKLSQYDNVTIMNDTCFGPLFDLEKTYLDMEQRDIDFWGLTNYRNDKRGIYVITKPADHIQSYFICFNKNVINSASFKIFWENVKYENKVEKVIHNYEIRFTRILTKAGFKYSVLLDKAAFPSIESDHLIAFSRPDLCLKFKVPFLKIKSFFNFSHPKYIITLLQKNTSYTVSTILNHLNQIYDPGTTLFIQDKLVDNNEQNKCLFHDIKIAIHLHTYFMDILDKYMVFLNDTTANFDLYITTDTPEKKDAIHNYLRNQACFSKLKEIIITETHGRDVIPWLSIKDRLNQYDIVGHFHTKKTLHTEEWEGITWLDDILYSLLYNIKTIINEFMSNDNLGIIIPEVPYILRNEILNDSNVNLIRISENLWKRLKCNKTLDFKVIKNIIFPMGNMFWYRPAALKPLFELRLLPGDIPQEPLPNETILHSIERLVVYIAWNEGYDYRISLPPKLRESNFVTAEKLYDTVSSLTYKTGELILTLPKAIKQFLKK